MRKDSTQLPSEEELSRIFAKEVKREIPPNKQNKHFASIDPLISFLQEVGFDAGEISQSISWQEQLDVGNKLAAEIKDYIQIKDAGSLAKPAKALYHYLAEEDNAQKADVILAFGAKTMARAGKAVELYQQGLAPRLMFTGGSPIYAPNEPEAEKYKRFALAAGIPQEAIITETKSISLPDNVRSSLNILDDLGITYQSLILVNSPYSQRRGYGYAQKFSPEDTKLYRVNCTAGEGLRENDWFTNEKGINYVLNEYIKIWMGIVTNTI